MKTSSTPSLRLHVTRKLVKDNAGAVLSYPTFITSDVIYSIGTWNRIKSVIESSITASDQIRRWPSPPHVVNSGANQFHNFAIGKRRQHSIKKIDFFGCVFITVVGRRRSINSQWWPPCIHPTTLNNNNNIKEALRPKWTTKRKMKRNGNNSETNIKWRQQSGKL